MTDRRLEILAEFADAQSWTHGAIAQAERKHAQRRAEQVESWEETRRFKLLTDPRARARRKESNSKYERTRWQRIKADPVALAAHNAKRMHAHYRAKESKK